MSIDASTPSSRQYLVTGAGSGIGLAVVQALALAGHRVWAGARREEDWARLAAIPGVEALPLDLLSPASATAARDALSCAAPQARYLVGTRWEGERVLDALTERLIDAATSPGQRLDRTALLARVDAAWRARGWA